MTINLQKPDITELKPRITVFGVGGGGGNAVNNMISGGLEGVEFVVANTDSQALHASRAERVIQMGVQVTEGLGAGSQPQIGQQAAEECIDEIRDHLSGTHMAFVTAGMGGGTGTGAAPVVARAAREMGILTVGVVTKPFGFEGGRRMKTAELGIEELQSAVDTLIVIPNQNLFRIADEKTTLAEAFAMADQVLYEGVACITDLMVKEGLINLDFADVRSVMQEMGKAMMGTGEASGEKRAMNAAEAAIANPLLDETNMAGAQGLLISITGGRDMTLFELDEAATRIREEVDESANIIMGATFDDSLEGIIRVSVVATGIDTVPVARTATQGSSISDNSKREAAERMRTAAQAKVQTPAAEGSPVEEPAPQEARQPSQEGAAPSATAGTLRVTAPATPAAQPRAEAPVRAQPADYPSEEFGRELVESMGGSAQAAMPKVEDFPGHAQDAMRREAHEERGAFGLINKLARGLGSQHPTAHGGHGQQQAPAARAPQPVQQAQPARAPQPAPQSQPAVQPVAQPAARSPQADVQSPYAPARNGLDAHGRPAQHPVATPAPQQPQGARLTEDDLEIPAFLRRSNG